MTLRAFIGLAAMLALSVIPPMTAAQAASLPTTKLRINGQTIIAEVAATKASRTHGLMNRASLPNGHGMIFVFDTVDTYCFWMKDTTLPLSIAFIDDLGTIINTDDMQPLSEAAHCPLGPIRYALEMKQGWFAAHHIAAESRVSGLPRPLTKPATKHP